MNSVSIEKKRLIDVVTTNRGAHRATFEAALEGWKTAVLKRVQEMYDEAVVGKLVNLAVQLPRPEDHTPDYDRVLLMLDFSVDETFALDEHEFAQYVQDEWGWKRQFLQTASAYTVGASG